MLILGYVLYKYIPTSINTATLYFLLCGRMPSEQLIKQSFLSCLDDPSTLIIKTAETTSSFSNELTGKLISIFSQFDMSSSPTSNISFCETLGNISKHVLIQKPFYLLHSVREGVNERKDSPLVGLPEATFFTLLEECRPSGNAIVNNLRPKYSDDPESYGHEERVFGFLETFAQTLGGQESAIFAKYVTGCECIFEMKVHFNGHVSNEMMIPRANTCGPALHLSRYISSQRQF